MCINVAQRRGYSKAAAALMGRPTEWVRKKKKILKEKK